MSIKHLPWPHFLNLRLLANTPRAFKGVLVSWVVSFLALPWLELGWGQTALVAGVTLGVLLQATAVFISLVYAWGLSRAFWTATVVLVLAWSSEALGVATGWPFGAYTYTDQLQPQLAGVPLLIPLAWLMMLPPAWAIAVHITGARHGLAFVGLSAAAFTAWDLFLDPQMVAWGLWQWASPGGYFGIPWLNYAGWLLVSALITMVARPPTGPVRPLILVYTLTWLLEMSGLILFWGLFGPALVGGLGMGSLIWLAWKEPEGKRI